MKKIRPLLTSLLVLAVYFGVAQVKIDKPVQLTGTGSDAAVQGIKSVANSQDATSVEALQNGNFIYAIDAGSANNFVLNITPPITAYRPGMFFNFISGQAISGPATINIDNLGTVAVKKNINQDLGQCDVQSGQIVTLVYDGTNFQMTSAAVGVNPTIANAGNDSLNINDTITSLSGNTPLTGTGVWSVVSGGGGIFSNTSSPTSTFTGVKGTTYILRWTISALCGNSYDEVSISFANHGSQTFSAKGGPYDFTVGAGISSVTIECWGAQGFSFLNSPATLSNSWFGGMGGYSTGSLGVSPGDVLKVYVGGQDGTNGGGVGGSNAGGSGGGASDVRVGGLTFNNRIIVAGGGGGACAWTSTGIGGGAGGGATGGNSIQNGGCTITGGTQLAGGDSGNGYTGGSFGNGGPAGANIAGGGGGWYGGGGGGNCIAAGAGGSGYVGGVSGGSMQSGVQNGDGKVVVSW